AIPEAAGLGELADLGDDAFDRLILESIDANRNGQAGANERDAGFVHGGLDLHIVGVRQPDDDLPLADRRAGGDDELRAAAVVGFVGIDDLAGSGGPDRAFGDLVLNFLEPFFFQAEALLLGFHLGFGR